MSFDVKRTLQFEHNVGEKEKKSNSVSVRKREKGDVGEMKVNKFIETSKKADIISNEINSVMEEWINHTKAHFSRENTLMETYNFPAYRCHLNEHELALKQLEMIFRNWLEQQDLNELAEYVQAVWPQWFVNHISTMDIVTSAFISQQVMSSSSKS